ncbi:hypothetical protein, partial [Mycobacterium marseillense]|uniref:hypothetical protein n=1 Tax=Mycobacterium marseillense TaxID=701042 RepID=UPI0010425E9E
AKEVMTLDTEIAETDTMIEDRFRHHRGSSGTVVEDQVARRRPSRRSGSLSRYSGQQPARQR